VNYCPDITEDTHPRELQGNWNKETMIAKTLAETTPEEAEWIMWVDIDTIIADMTIVPRFDEYEGADLIVWGQRDKLMQGNLNEGDKPWNPGCARHANACRRCSWHPVPWWPLPKCNIQCFLQHTMG
jgi:hypothetical protein